MKRSYTVLFAIALVLGLSCPQALPILGKKKVKDVEQAAEAARLKKEPTVKAADAASEAEKKPTTLTKVKETLFGKKEKKATSEDIVEQQKIQTLEEEQEDPTKAYELPQTARTFAIAGADIKTSGDFSNTMKNKIDAVQQADNMGSKLDELDGLVRGIPRTINPAILAPEQTTETIALMKLLADDLVKSPKSTENSEQRQKLAALAREMEERLGSKEGLKQKLSEIQALLTSQATTKATETDVTTTKTKKKLGTKAKIGIAAGIGALAIAGGTAGIVAAVTDDEEDEGKPVDTSGFFAD